MKSHFWRTLSILKTPDPSTKPRTRSCSCNINAATKRKLAFFLQPLQSFIPQEKHSASSHNQPPFTSFHSNDQSPLKTGIFCALRQRLMVKAVPSIQIPYSAQTIWISAFPFLYGGSSDLQHCCELARMAAQTAKKW